MICEENNEIEIIAATQEWKNYIDHDGYCIYGMITTKSDGIYIGQTINFKERRRSHFKNKKINSMPICHAIQKHGKESFDMFILEYCDTLDELNEAEERLIKLYKLLGFRLYNVKNGGNNHAMSESTKEKLRQINLGKPGVVHTEESKLKMSEANKGRKKSLKEIEKIINTRKQNGITISKKCVIAGIESQYKPIISIDKNGNEIKFKSLVEASEILNISYSKIKNALNVLQNKTNEGYTFKYINENDELNRLNKLSNKKYKSKEIIAINNLGIEFKFENLKMASKTLNISYNKLKDFSCGKRLSNLIDGYMFKFPNK